jgi:hypothetical protein
LDRTCTRSTRMPCVDSTECVVTGETCVAGTCGKSCAGDNDCWPAPSPTPGYCDDKTDCSDLENCVGGNCVFIDACEDRSDAWRCYAAFELLGQAARAEVEGEPAILVKWENRSNFQQYNVDILREPHDINTPAWDQALETRAVVYRDPRRRVRVRRPRQHPRGLLQRQSRCLPQRQPLR